LANHWPGAMNGFLIYVFAKWRFAADLPGIHSPAYQ
jgi:hypothetical protein